MRVLIITPVEVPVVQSWLRCKFDLAAGQSLAQSSINEVSFSIELVDHSFDLQVSQAQYWSFILALMCRWRIFLRYFSGFISL